MTRFVTFGETLVQYNAKYSGPFRENGDYLLDRAGAESNVAVDLQKLGAPGLRTIWISRVGDDAAGDFVLRELDGRTEVAAELHKGERTGVSYLNHLSGNQHVKTYHRKGSAASRLAFEQLKPYLRNADLLHVTGITPALSAKCYDTVLQSLRYSQGHGIPISFDLNYRTQLWSPSEARTVFEEMLPRSSLFKLGQDEAETVWGKGFTPGGNAEYFQHLTGGVVVVTRGVNGAIAFDGMNRIEHPGYKVRAVDPIGAGDAFVAGFIAAILQRCNPKDFFALDANIRRPILENALEIANVCGTLTCTKRGDTAAMPTLDEVGTFVTRHTRQ